MFQKIDENTLRNVYSWEIINKTAQDITNIEFKLKEPADGRINLVGAPANIISPKQGIVKGVMMIDMPNAKVTKQKTGIVIEVYSGNKLIDKTRTNFLGPIR
jgi:hypothetical protein